ncbi:MAG: O-antigen ligase family protein [Xanthobacteraceae bacterium]|nr:O-antigen ligase family protein [Xanthobacteraceae bacterium]
MGGDNSSRNRQLAGLADCLAIALAASLPWSTSATSILGWIWLVVVLGSLDWAALVETIRRPAGALPLALFLLGLVGMAWANVAWVDRYYGFDSFEKLFAIPLLLAQFQRSSRGYQVLAAFLISATVLLVISWLAAFWILPPKPNKDIGVFVKDRITQGTEFTLCLIFLLELASHAWRAGKRMAALAACLLAGVFFLNIVFVTVSRTSLVTVPILLLIFGVRHFRPRQLAVFVLVIVMAGGLVAALSPHLRQRVAQIPVEIATFDAQGHDTSAGARIAFWGTSLEIMRSAPLLGHGTGSINAEFSEAAGHVSNATNPHNQTLAVGIQLGIVGIAILIAMWIAHLRLFLAPGIAAGIGLAVVVENVVGSLFNSQLFDFTQGWIYVVGAGVAGGTVLRAPRRSA